MPLKVPCHVGNTLVEQHGEPMLVKGERWVTLAPLDVDDERLWEFSLDSGRIIQTKD